MRAVTLVWEERDEARDDGGLGGHGECKAFCTWRLRLGALVVWEKEDVLGGVYDGAQ